MKKCNKCNRKFSILYRVKSLNKKLGEMKCDNCKTTYRRKSNLSISISRWLTGFLCVYIGSALSKTTNLFRFIIGGIIGFILFNIFILISDYEPIE
jgi:CXXC-20-CXXC protein